MRPLDVIGRVEIETPAGTATVSGRGSTLDLHMPTLRVLRALTRIPGSKRSSIRRIRSGLRRGGLTLDVRLGDHLVLTLEPGAFPRLRPWSLLRATLA